MPTHPKRLIEVDLAISDFSVHQQCAKVNPDKGWVQE
jgi:hypothetical protein